MRSIRKVVKPPTRGLSRASGGSLRGAGHAHHAGRPRPAHSRSPRARPRDRRCAPGTPRRTCRTWSWTIPDADPGAARMLSVPDAILPAHDRSLRRKRSLVPPPPPPRPARYFSPWFTAFCTVVVVILMSLYAAPWRGSPLDQLERPAESLERLVTRDLDVRDALRSAPTVGATALHGAVRLRRSGRGGAPLVRRAARGGGRPSPPRSTTPSCRPRRASRPPTTSRPTRRWWRRTPRSRWRRRKRAPSSPAFAPPCPRTGSPTPSWRASRGRRAILPTAERAQADIVTRGRRLLGRWLGLTATELALIALTIALLVVARARGGVPGWAPPRCRLAWGFADGYALVVRGVLGLLGLTLVILLVVPGRARSRPGRLLRGGAPRHSLDPRLSSRAGRVVPGRLRPWAAVGPPGLAARHGPRARRRRRRRGGRDGRARERARRRDALGGRAAGGSSLGPALAGRAGRARYRGLDALRGGAHLPRPPLRHPPHA